jgi:prepilin-type N-terminal cleavage/methylation domain-containing protein
MRRRRGFTLVELMVVVTLIGVIASVAVISLRGTRSTGDADAWANTVRNLVTQTRRRAVATGQTYMLDVRPNRLQWCQVNDVSAACGGTPAPLTQCPNATPGTESGGLVWAPTDAIVDSWYDRADVAQLGGPNNGYAAPGTSRIALPSTGSVPLYFGANGTVDFNYCKAVGIGQTLFGATLYVRASNVTPSATSQAQKHRRIIVYGISGRPRIIDNW